MKCKDCGKEINEDYRFTDWDYDVNDCYGTYEECLELFKKAVKENPEGRFSIFDRSGCDCGTKDEGILYNENCPEYKLGEE